MVVSVVSSVDCLPSTNPPTVTHSTEAVVISPSPVTSNTSVYSQLEVTGHRRYREEVQFRPTLHPVKYADTAYLWLNNTAKRFVSKTYYVPSIKPKGFSETTFTHPPCRQERYVSYLDHDTSAKRKWFKTAVEIKARKYRSMHVFPSQTDINSNDNINNNSSITVNSNIINIGNSNSNGSSNINENGNPDPSVTSRDQITLHIPHDHSTDDQDSAVARRFREIYDPGASQVYIPRRRDTEAGRRALQDGGVFLNFGNGEAGHTTSIVNGNENYGGGGMLSNGRGGNHRGSANGGGGGGINLTNGSSRFNGPRHNGPSLDYSDF